MSLGCFQKIQKRWGTHVPRVLSKIAKMVGGACPSGALKKCQKTTVGVACPQGAIKQCKKRGTHLLRVLSKMPKHVGVACP
jgi:hypothetical protein